MRRSVGEEDPQQRADPREHGDDTGGVERRLHALLEARGPLGQSGVRLDREVLEGRQASSRRERIPRKRAGLIDASERRHIAHDLATRAVGAHGQATADDLAEAPHIGLHTEPLGCAAATQTKTGDDFIKEQHRPGGVAGFAKALEEARRRGHQPHVRRNRFDTDHGDRVVDLGDDVVRRHDRVLDRARRHALGTLEALLGDPRTAGDEQGVGVAVVVTGELQDLAAAGCTASEPDRRHRRFGAGRDESHHLEPLNPARHLFGDPHLVLGGSAIARAAGSGIPNRRDDVGMGMTEDRRAVALHIVDVAATLDVVDEWAVRSFDEVRRPADRAEGPHRRVHTAGDDGLTAFEQGCVRVAHTARLPTAMGQNPK